MAQYPKDRRRKMKRGAKYVIGKDGKPVPARKTAKEVKLLMAGTEKDEGIEGEVFESTGRDEYGRQYAVTQDVRLALIKAFAFGCTVEEAALFAGISKGTLYTFFKENPKFEAHCRDLQDHPVLLARQCLVNAAAKQPYFALKYLERKRADEFALRIRQSLIEPEPPDDDELKLLDEVLNDNLDE